MSKLNSQKYSLILKQGLSSNVDTTATKNAGVIGEPAYVTDTKQFKIHNGTEYDAPVVMTATPTTAGSPGTAGQTAYDADYIYVCVADSTWKRSLLTTW